MTELPEEVSAATGSARPVPAVLVVDDQAPFRRAARDIVAAMPGAGIVGEARTGEDAVELARLLRPDLVLMDVRLPGIDGAEAARRILAIAPDTAVVLVSTHRARDLGINLLACGALAFVPKEDLDPDALTQLLQRAAPGPAR